MVKLRKLSKLFFVIITLVSFNSTTFGSTIPAVNNETDTELVQAEQRLNKMVLESGQKELKEIQLFDESKIADKTQLKAIRDKKASRLRVLQRIKSYKDLKSEGTLSDMVLSLQQKNYPIDENFLAICKEVETYITSNPNTDPKDVVKYINSKAEGNSKGIVKSILEPIFINKAHAAYSISYSTWTSLTTAEKLLIATDPKAALMTNSLSKLAFDYTKEKFGYNGLGDKSDGYRHGIWNALMTRDISRSWAQAYSTAHEDRPKSELDKKQTDGFTGWQHKAMDLNNNSVGRSVIAWYEFFFNCSDSTVKSRISAKLTNTTGNIIWLHN